MSEESEKFPHGFHGWGQHAEDESAGSDDECEPLPIEKAICPHCKGGICKQECIT